MRAKPAVPVTPERIAAIKTEWIRNHIRDLESQIRYLDTRNADLEQQVKAVNEAQAETETGVRAVLDDVTLALPSGCAVVFSGRFEVSAGDGDQGGISIELCGGNGALVIMPEGNDLLTICATSPGEPS